MQISMSPLSVQTAAAFLDMSSALKKIKSTTVKVNGPIKKVDLQSNYHRDVKLKRFGIRTSKKSPSSPPAPKNQTAIVILNQTMILASIGVNRLQHQRLISRMAPFGVSMINIPGCFTLMTTQHKAFGSIHIGS